MATVENGVNKVNGMGGGEWGGLDGVDRQFSVTLLWGLGPRDDRREVRTKVSGSQGMANPSLEECQKISRDDTHL